jgi:hypothetical protein
VLGDVEETIYIVDEEDDEDVKVSSSFLILQAVVANKSSCRPSVKSPRCSS